MRAHDEVQSNAGTSPLRQAGVSPGFNGFSLVSPGVIKGEPVLVLIISPVRLRKDPTRDMIFTSDPVPHLHRGNRSIRDVRRLYLERFLRTKKKKCCQRAKVLISVVQRVFQHGSMLQTDKRGRSSACLQFVFHPLLCPLRVREAFAPTVKSSATQMPYFFFFWTTGALACRSPALESALTAD